MDKLILVIYVNVAKQSPRDIDETMQRVRDHLDPKDENILSYYMPVFSGDNRVECINPKLVSEDDYVQAKEALDTMIEKLKTI